MNVNINKTNKSNKGYLEIFEILKTLSKANYNQSISLNNENLNSDNIMDTVYMISHIKALISAS